MTATQTFFDKYPRAQVIGLTVDTQESPEPFTTEGWKRLHEAVEAQEIRAALEGATWQNNQWRGLRCIIENFAPFTKQNA